MLILVVTSLAEPPEIQNWRSVSGKEIRATFVRLNDDQVVLRSTKGIEKAFPVSLFSEASIQQINQLSEQAQVKQASVMNLAPGSNNVSTPKHRSDQLVLPRFLPGKLYVQEKTEIVSEKMERPSQPRTAVIEAATEISSNSNAGTIALVRPTKVQYSIPQFRGGVYRASTEHMDKVEDATMKAELEDAMDSVAAFYLSADDQVTKSMVSSSPKNGIMLFEKDLREFGPGLLSLFPNRPIELGQSWEYSNTKPMGPFTLKTLQTLTFARNESLDGRNCAVVTIKGSVTGKSHTNIPIEDSSIHGELWIDRDSRLIPKYQFSVSLNLAASGPSPAMTKTIDSTIVLKNVTDAPITEPENALVGLVEINTDSTQFSPVANLVVKSAKPPVSMQDTGNTKTNLIATEILESYISTMQSRLPIEIDPQTTLLRVQSEPGGKLHYFYELKAHKEDFDLTILEEGLQKMLRENYDSPKMTVFRENNIQVIYTYLDLDGEQLGEFKFGP